MFRLPVFNLEEFENSKGALGKTTVENWISFVVRLVFC